jgi:hypothetical protein
MLGLRVIEWVHLNSPLFLLDTRVRSYLPPLSRDCVVIRKNVIPNPSPCHSEGA